MTDEWIASLYNKSGNDLLNAHIERLINEFKYLGAARAETKQTTAEADCPAAWDEAT